LSNSGTKKTLGVTETVLEDSMEKVAASVKPWREEDYILHSLLQEAVRNHGRVDMMQQKSGGPMLAVKRMPNKWVRQGPTESSELYPSEAEKPWVDLGLVRHLNSIKYPYVCELLGVFRDNEHTYVASSLATCGDLFSWSIRDPNPGPLREASIFPLAIQIFSAVRTLHEFGVAHRDLSLENILLTELPSGEQRIRLIDFGMATVNRICPGEVRGKLSYQSPEMHSTMPYDAFLADVFALGIVLFAMAVQDYPWTSTKQKKCRRFEYSATFGFRKFLKKQTLLNGNGERLADVFSAELAELLQGLLQVQPEDRLVLGELCYAEHHESAWNSAWLQCQKRAITGSTVESM